VSEDGEFWGDASVTYPDWQGTAQLDQRMTSAGIEELVGLNQDDWTVVGIDIGGGESGLHDLAVVAVHRDAETGVVDRRSDESLYQAMARANGGKLEATHFLVHGLDQFEVLTKMMHVFDFRLRSRGVLDVSIRITRDDLNLPDE
jgi:hypothetical protein